MICGQSQSRRHAFTLVELLVVIGIIALLISILLPTLNRARQSAKEVQCKSNMRSVGQGIMFYANEFQGSLPHGSLNVFAAGIPDTEQWRWPDYIQSMLDPAAGPSRADAYLIPNGKLSSRDVLLCPEAPTQAAAVSPFHYSAHPMMMPERPANNTNPRLEPYKLGSVKESSERGLLFEASLIRVGGAGIDQNDWSPRYNVPVAFRIDQTRMWNADRLSTIRFEVGRWNYVNPSASISMQSATPGNANTDSIENEHNVRFRHGDNTKTNVLFVDGHVADFVYNPKKGETDPQVTTLLRRNVYVNPRAAG